MLSSMEHRWSLFPTTDMDYMLTNQYDKIALLACLLIFSTLLLGIKCK